MGMYTSLFMAVNVKGDTPKEVIDVLKFMLKHGAEETQNNPPLPDHPLFKLETGRWRWMLRCSSYYHSGDPVFRFNHDDISHDWHLTVYCDLKNYENEIQHFIDWIKPYCEQRGFAGFYRYEETDKPTLFYFGDEPEAE